MSPVRNVTYVSGRSSVTYTINFGTMRASALFRQALGKHFETVV